MRKVSILGIEVHDCDEDGAVNAIQGFLEEEAAGLRHVMTVNPEFIMEARHNKPFRQLLNSADLATPDGVGIVLAACLLGHPVKGRATGVALVQRLADISARTGKNLFLLGAAPGVAEEAAEEMVRRFPGVKIAGTYAGSPLDKDLPTILDHLRAAQPDALLVAYGAPRQDLWIERHREELPASVKVAMGVGGVFDYLSGRVPLAPEVWRKLGLEWLYRLIKQPWRWRRIIRVFQFGAIILKEVLWTRLSGIRKNG